MALLSVKDACIGYGGFLLLDRIDLNIERHERVCLLGRNGSGKTTLMKLINGEITPDSGAVSRSQGITTARLDQEIPAGIAGPVIDIVTSGLAAKGRLLADYHSHRRHVGRSARKTTPGFWPAWTGWGSSWTRKTAGRSIARSTWSSPGWSCRPKPSSPPCPPD